MANTITGKILSIGTSQQIPSKDGSKNYVKRELILDATRFDPFTGERGFENTPSFEFFGDRCGDLDHYHVGQVVTISFDLQGNKYTNRDGLQKIMTSVRPYKIELKHPMQQVQQPLQQVQQPMRQASQQYIQPQQGYQPQAPFPPQQGYQQKPPTNDLPF